MIYFGLILQIILFSSIFLKRLAYKEKITINFFLFPLTINFLIVFFRVGQIFFRNTLSTDLFIIFSAFYAIIFFFCLAYLNITSNTVLTPNRNKENLLTLFLKKTQPFFLRIASGFLELYDSFKIFCFGRLFVNMNFFESLTFLGKYFFKNIKIITLSKILWFFVGQTILLIIYFEICNNKIFFAILAIFFFNVSFRVAQALLFAFQYFVEFRFLLKQPDFCSENLANYFYDWLFLDKVFKNWKNKLTRAETQEKVFFFLTLKDFFHQHQIIKLLIKNNYAAKKQIDIFLNLQFLFFFIFYLIIPMFSDFIIFLSVFYIYFSLKSLTLDKETKDFVNFIENYNFWLKNNKVDFIFFVSPEPKFFFGLLKKLKKLINIFFFENKFIKLKNFSFSQNLCLRNKKDQFKSLLDFLWLFFFFWFFIYGFLNFILITDNLILPNSINFFIRCI